MLVCAMECKWLTAFGSRLRSFFEVFRKRTSCVVSVHAYSNLHQEGIAVERSDSRPHTDYLGQVVEISKSCPSIGSAKTALVRPRQIPPGSQGSERKLRPRQLLRKSRSIES